MARQGKWADNIIIQAVANYLNVTTGTQFNVITYYLIGHLKQKVWLSLHVNQVAYKARAYHSILSIRQLQIFLLSLRWELLLHCRDTLTIKFARISRISGLNVDPLTTIESTSRKTKNKDSDLRIKVCID